MANILLSYAEAAELVTRYIAALADHTGASQASPSQFPFKQPAFERVSLSAALGRVLAEAILADRDQPPFPRSTRDGFACRAAEANTHQLLHLAGQVRAGECASVGLNPGEVWEIMTGAPVPEGADAVFMIEHAKLSPDFVALAEPEIDRTRRKHRPPRSRGRCRRSPHPSRHAHSSRSNRHGRPVRL